MAKIAALMDQWGLGGRRWLKQFIYGLGVAWPFSQAELFRKDLSLVSLALYLSLPLRPPLGADSIRGGGSDRFRGRAKASGFKHSNTLWGDAPAQRENGLLSGTPLLLVGDGLPPCFKGGGEPCLPRPGCAD